MGEVRSLFSRILKSVILHYKIIIFMSLLSFFVIHMFNEREVTYTGSINYTTDYSTNYGTYSSGISNPSDLENLILSAEFLDRFSAENDLTEASKTFISKMNLMFLDANHFELRYQPKDLALIEKWIEYINQHSSSYISYVLQKRALDTFVVNYSNAYWTQQNQLTANNALISLYEQELENTQQYLINTPPIIVINPTFSYLDQKKVDLVLSNLQIEPNANYYLTVLQDLQAQQALYVTYDGYLSSDHRFDQYIKVENSVNTQSLILSRLNLSEIVVYGAMLTIISASVIIYLYEKYRFSKETLTEVSINLKSVWLDFSKLKTEFKNLWKHMASLFNSIRQLIQQRV